jgi:hypothetical protein
MKLSSDPVYKCDNLEEMLCKAIKEKTNPTKMIRLLSQFIGTHCFQAVLIASRLVEISDLNMMSFLG